MQKKSTRGSKYYQDLNRVLDRIRKAPVAVLYQVFEISPYTVAGFKAKELSHRQLALADKELKAFLSPDVKLPFRYCPYCSSSRVLVNLHPSGESFVCNCTICKRQIEYVEGGEIE